MNLTEGTQALTALVASLVAEPEDLDTGLVAWAAIEQARKDLIQLGADLAAVLADRMPAKGVTVMGVGHFEAHRKTSRKQWDTDDLRRAVLDTRLVNTTTGEVIEETPLEKVLKVWNLGAPRITVLRERGLDADQFCHAERGALTLQLIN